MSAARLPAALILASLASCRVPTHTAIDPAMASCVPPGAAIIAGFNMEQLRAALLYRKLPSAARLILEPFQNAGYVLLASDGRNLLSISRGQFREPPPGATLLRPNLALAGSPDWVRAAVAQHASGAGAAPDLLAYAEPAAANQLWVVLRGNVTLPLTGNAANLNRLLQWTQHVTITAQLDDRVAAAITAVCRTADGGRDFEQSLRAMLSLAAAANSRQPDLAALLGGIQIGREDRTIRLSLSANADAIDALMRAF